MMMDPMSDDDRDIDIESDDDDNDDSDTKSQNGRGPNSTQHFSQAEKRAHHNALERKRRDHIKDSFNSLRESVPSLAGDKSVNIETHGSQRQSKASRAQILRKAAEFIQFMRRKNQSHQQNIDDLKRQNNSLELQIRQLEQQRDNFSGEVGPADEITESEEEEDDDEGEVIDENDDDDVHHHLQHHEQHSQQQHRHEVDDDDDDEEDDEEDDDEDDGGGSDGENGMAQDGGHKKMKIGFL